MTDLRIDAPVEAPGYPSPPVPLPSPAPDNPEEALSWLGGTVEEVAEGLRARGIKGVQFESDSCPLAMYLRTWWEDAHVAGGVFWLESTCKYVDGRMPSACQQFEMDFDDRLFPDLIDT